MKMTNRTIWVALILLSFGAHAETKVQELGGDWYALAMQSDPFDSSKIKINQIRKGEFVFRCNELNMEAPSYGYESLSFSAELKYIVDASDFVDKVGGYSTYLGGSDLVTDSRYYYFDLSSDDVSAFKKGNILKVAGKYSTNGWLTKELNLSGFTKAYDAMCSGSES